MSPTYLLSACYLFLHPYELEYPSYPPYVTPGPWASESRRETPSDSVSPDHGWEKTW
jgi:hypothetical protein